MKTELKTYYQKIEKYVPRLSFCRFINVFASIMIVFGIALSYTSCKKKGGDDIENGSTSKSKQKSEAGDSKNKNQKTNSDRKENSKIEDKKAFNRKKQQTDRNSTDYGTKTSGTSKKKNEDHADHQTTHSGNNKKSNERDDSGAGGVRKKESGITVNLYREGLVSGSVYQVFITTFASTRAEATRTGLVAARRKAYNLIRKDPIIQGRSLSRRSAMELRRVIKKNSRIVSIKKEPGGAWSIVFRVEKDGLRAFLRHLR